MQVSDLFKDKGRFFDWENRIRDQEELLRRMGEVPELKSCMDEFASFADNAIVSMVFVEHMLKKITKVCSKNNVPMS